jgi:hypothetical protein
MDQPEAKESLAAMYAEGDAPVQIAAATPPAASSPARPAPEINGQRAPAPSYAPVGPSYVYAIGKIEPRFPSPAVEKEIAQATGRADTEGLTDHQALQQVLSQPENRYLARELCWVMTIQGLDTYIVTPRDPVDLTMLVEVLRPNPKPSDLDVLIGVKGSIAGPGKCNGLLVPIVGFDQVYSFDRGALISAIPRPENIGEEEFPAAAAELFYRIIQITDNAGATDEDRTLNYLAMRYPAIYARAAEAFARNEALTAIEVTPSRLSGTRTVADAIFSYTNRNTDVIEKFFVRVDVTEKYPFLVTRLSPYFDR